MKKAFVSFDLDNDQDLRSQLMSLLTTPDSPAYAAGFSMKEPKIGDWQGRVRDRVKQADVVVVICGEKTHEAECVAAELDAARKAKIPYFLLLGRKGRTCTKPKTAQEADKLYEWSWENIKNLFGGAR